MMKNWIIGLFLVLSVIVAAPVFSLDEMDTEGISLKAGPTDITEDVPLAWVEASLYPKAAERGQEIFVGVRLASTVKSVKLNLDSDKTALSLESDDGKNWSRIIKIPADLLAGLHIARISIIGQNDKLIQRTLDFAVMEDARAERNIPLTVLNVAPLIEDGETLRQLLPGVKVTALYKAPFYRVKLDDGREGWLEASKVKEPTEELYFLGYNAYQNDEFSVAADYFRQVLLYDPAHPRAHFYLARIYLKQNKYDQAASEIKETLSLEPENKKARDLAGMIAQRYLEKKDYAKVFELKPELLVQKLNENSKNKIIFEVKATSKPEPKTEVPLAIPRDILKDSIGAVKSFKTSKGTTISSAINSVLALTRSLGTKIHEDGWRVAAASDGIRVIYGCRQEHDGKVEDENFEWKIDPDLKSAAPANENARLLMNRW